ncbi:ABC transporter permease [Megasphaera sueciensis]|uniref:ABC transporter permease n=1 Tax=Megasphaera sueciensis TaxID=349094 RepID=UPI003CFE21DE
MKNFSEIVRREHHVLWQHSSPVALVFLTPLIFCILFGIVYKENTVRHIPIVIYDQDQSSVSRSLIQVYDDSERFDVKYYVNTQEEMSQLLKEGKAQVALGIPKDFSKQIKLGYGTDVVLAINSTNNIFANSALSAIEENDRTFSVSIAQKLVESAGVLPSEAMNTVDPIRIGVRILNNPTTGYTSFMLPGIVLNGVQIALLLTVPSLASIAKQNMYGPEYSSLGIMLAKALPYWGMAVLSYIVSLGGLSLFWAVPIRAQFWQLLWLGCCFSFAVIGILYLFFSLCPNETLAVQIPLLYIMPGLLFSGLSWPLLSMQGFGRWYAGIMPITYTADNMRDLMLAGYAPSLNDGIQALLIMGIIAEGLAWGVFSLSRYWKQKKQPVKQGNLS